MDPGVSIFINLHENSRVIKIKIAKENCFFIREDY